MRTKFLSALFAGAGVVGVTYLVINSRVLSEESPLQRRVLSEALPNGGCRITFAEQPDEPIEPTFAASFPGSGARMTWNLIEALTGVVTGDDWDLQKRGTNVVTIKTHYPHDNGQLIDEADKINRVLLILRNPKDAIPSFHNHLFEMFNHLDVHSIRAPVNEWIEWRDKHFDVQLKMYKEFVEYWTDNYESENRLTVSYEKLVNDALGPSVAKKITSFLGQVKGVTPIEEESVPCIWRTVVKYHKGAKGPQKRASNGSRTLKEVDPQTQDRRALKEVDANNPAQPSSLRSGPKSRPYTRKQIDAMIFTLVFLIERYSSDSSLVAILEMYVQDLTKTKASEETG